MRARAMGASTLETAYSRVLADLEYLESSRNDLSWPHALNKPGHETRISMAADLRQLISAVGGSVSDAELMPAAIALWDYRHPAKRWEDATYDTQMKYLDEIAPVLKAAALARAALAKALPPNPAEDAAGA